MDSAVVDDESRSSVPQATSLHLGLDLLGKSLELIHLQLLHRPADAQTFGLVWLGDLNRTVTMLAIIAMPTNSPI